jgi:hypothetical protein
MLNHHGAHLTIRLRKYQTEICRLCGFAWPWRLLSAFDISASSLAPCVDHEQEHEQE